MADTEETPNETPDTTSPEVVADAFDETEPTRLNELRKGYLPYMYSMHAPRDTIPSCDAPSCITAFLTANPKDPLYRCKDCHGGGMRCHGCLKKSHQYLPFHRVEQWNGECFQDIPLHTLGVKLCLGHDGDECTSYGVWPRCPDIITVMHTNAIHRVHVRYCTCRDADEPWQQMLDYGMVAATHIRPSTAFTFDVLNQFQNFNLTSKVSAYDFCNSLRFQTDSVMPQDVPVSPSATSRHNETRSS